MRILLIPPDGTDAAEMSGRILRLVPGTTCLEGISEVGNGPFDLVLTKWDPDFLTLLTQLMPQTPLIGWGDDPPPLTEAFGLFCMGWIESRSDDRVLDSLLQRYIRFRQHVKESASSEDVRAMFKMMNLLQDAYKSRFLVKAGKMIKSVDVGEVAWIQSHEGISRMACFDGRKYPLDQPLDELESQLDPRTFLRANRQFIVHIASVNEIHPHFKGRLKIKLNPEAPEEIVISSERSKGFKEWLSL